MKGVIGVGSWKARFSLRYVKCSVSCLHANWNGRWWLSCSVTSNSLRPHGLQHTRPPCPSLSPWSFLKFMYTESMIPSNHLISVAPFSSYPRSFPASVSFPVSWLVWSPCSPRDSQESSPAPQFKSISSSALSLLYGPTLTSVHDYWKNHSFYCTDLCWQCDVCFLILSLFCHSLNLFFP